MPSSSPRTPLTMKASGKRARALASPRAFSSPLPLNGLSFLLPFPELGWVVPGLGEGWPGLLALVWGGCLELLPSVPQCQPGGQMLPPGVHCASPIGHEANKMARGMGCEAVAGVPTLCIQGNVLDCKWNWWPQ